VPLTKEENFSGLQVDQDLPFQEKEWTAERAGWIIGLLLLLAGLAGLFGGGPLSRAAPRQGPLRLEYSRFVRYRAPEVLTVQVDPGVSGETLQLWVDRAYLEDFELQQIVPAPDQTRVLPDRILYEFQAQPGDGPLRVTFQLRPQAAGSRSGRVGLEGGDTVTFRQFVYP